MSAASNRSSGSGGSGGASGGASGRVATRGPRDIRNIVLLGHGGAGKTTLAEAILHRCGVVTRMGSVEEQSTISDFEPEARGHRQSVSSSLLFASHAEREINLIDTPGHPEFVGHALAALPAAETAVLVVNATTGVEFNTRRLFHAAGEMGLARMIVVNRIDQNSSGLPGVLRDLRSAFGAELHPINLPSDGGADVIDCFDHEAGEADFGSVAEVHREMLESTIEIDDDKLERYLAGEEIDLAELRQCFVEAMNQGHVVPVLFTAARSEVGVDDLLHILVEEAPSPVTGRPRRERRGDEVVEIPCDPDKPFLAHVFKITNDPYVGTLAMLRILQGKLDGQTAFVSGVERKPHKAGHVLKVEGRDHPEIDSVAWAGDLVALAKVEGLHVGQILRDPQLPDELVGVRPRYPTPMYSLAIEPKTRADEVKLGAALQKLAEEDPTFTSRHDPQTHELVVSGLGDVHLRVTLEKLQNRFNLEVTSKEPTVAYRETITAKAEGHHRHKKQTGGAGQFGEVFLRVEPLGRGEGFEFKNDVFGGSIPTQYIPSVEKGILDVIERGALCGFPMQDVRVSVYDGKSHAVDSKDIAFRTAGRMAFKDAIEKARPVLLEPVVDLEITVPEASVGEVTGELKNKRGRVMGVEPLSGGSTLVRAQAPLAELGQYSGQLRGATGGQGSFVMELSHYDTVPPQVQQKLVATRGPGRHEEG